MKKKVAIVGAILFVVLAIVGAAAGSSEPTATGTTPTAPVTTPAPVVSTPAPVTPAPVATPDSTTEPGAEWTTGQSNAVDMAIDYLSTMSFSRKGLIEQLEYEGFSKADASFAVKVVATDWKEQAARMAKDYLDTMSFSRKGLIEQLEYEGFSKAEATYGADQAYR